MGRIPLLVCLVAVLLASTALAAGCGGSDEDEPDASAEAACEKLESEAEREECEKAEVAKVIPEDDRAAYYVFATSNGMVRGAAVAAQRGERAPIAGGVGELRGAAARVAAAKPRDPALEDLQPQVLRLLRRARAPDFGRSEGAETLAEVRAIDRALNRYLRGSEPAQASLLPD
ncbi:MAG: hypothetical protein AABM29_05225 [Actinomycetota bacterium]